MSPRNNRHPLAVIFGCAGPVLTEAERRFFAQANPLGFILFARNVQEPAQLRMLVADLRASVGRADAPVLIDQEGGRVQRLRPPHWRNAPPGAAFAALAARDLELARQAVRLNNRLIAAELADLGIDVDCTPVLDVPVPGAHDVIGDRAYGADPAVIAELGRAVCDGMLDGGVIPIVKHIPGHGRAMVDSHKDLPRVATPLDELRRSDFAPFKALADAPWAMTAHVVYEAIDPTAPATTSPAAINLIRGELGFQGLLLSDDLSMQALSGDFGERTRAALSAGCDVALHCNGDMAEMTAIAAAARPLDEAGAARAARAAAMKRVPQPFDAAQALQRLAGWLGAASA